MRSMRWRPPRGPCKVPRIAPSSPHRRQSSLPASRLAISSLSIANILATPPADPPNTLTAIGFIRTIRNQKHTSFVELGDGSSVHSLQALLRPSQAEGLGTGTSVAITGQWRPSPSGKEQLAELQAEAVKIVGNTDPEKYPIQKKYHSAEYLRSIPHLRLRTPFNALLARLKSEADFHLANYFRRNDFVRVQPPIITSSDCEGAGEVFTVLAESRDRNHSQQDSEAFFRSPKFLTVSSQLHLEAFVHEHQKVWTLSPTFRAERSDTPRHVSEFWMLEAEMWTEELEDIMELVENMIRNLVHALQKSHLVQELVTARRKFDPLDIEETHSSDFIEERWRGFLRSRWPRITYTQAVERLQEAVQAQEIRFQHDVLWSRGLSLEHEKYIAACVGQGSPVFITDYPASVKPFYMLPSSRPLDAPLEPKPTAACFDLLLPDGCEVVGGSLREHRLDRLTASMHASGIDVPSSLENSGQPPISQPSDSSFSNLNWYLDLRRYGSVPHGGFGLGFDRLLGYMAGITNIRDVVTWPRYVGRCDG